MLEAALAAGLVGLLPLHRRERAGRPIHPAGGAAERVGASLHAKRLALADRRAPRVVRPLWAARRAASFTEEKTTTDTAHTGQEIEGRKGTSVLEGLGSSVI
eukprot:scaffold21317_cov112-Isochrysis_galbana.AAC.3